MACKYIFDNKEFNSKEKLKDFLSARKNLTTEVRRNLNDSAAPDMPYKKTDQWVGMAMRRAMQMAAQEGFDRIAWVTGEQSADRYDLSKQVDEVGWQKNENGTYNITPKKEGKVIGTRDTMSNLTIEEVENYIGKEVAQKIEKEEGKQWSGGNVVQGNLSGQQLEVGGEGMKTFYNSILPKVAKKEAQRFDKKANVEVVEIPIGEKMTSNKDLAGLPDSILNEMSEFEDGAISEKEFLERMNKRGYEAEIGQDGDIASVTPKNKGLSKQLSIPITPEMRRNLSAAIPLFQKAAEAQKIDTPIEVISAIESRLKQSGLSSDIVTLSVDQIDVVLEEIGVSEDMRRQVVAWHGTQRKDKDITVSSFKNEAKYGKLLSGTYFGNKAIAAGFAGVFDGSKLLKASIDETQFEKIDMEGKTPTTDAELESIIGKKRLNELVNKKASGEIKGIILENTFEKNFPIGLSTQYLVFDNSTVEVIEEFVGERLEEESMDTWMSYDTDFLDFQKTLAEDGITLIPQGFVHGDTVYLNEEAIDPVNTLIHEHGHLFNSWAKENRPEIYKKGIELIQEQGQEYIDYVKQVQPNLTGEALLEEALTQAIGDRGARIVDESRRSSIVEWLEGLWQSVKEVLGITRYTADQLQELSLQEFAEAVSIDLLSGGGITTGQVTGRTRLMVLGEKGVDKESNLKDLLNEAKRLRNDGATKSDILDNTGWFFEEGSWRYFSSSTLEGINIKTEIDKSPGKSYNLSEVIGEENPIFEYYPTLREIKVDFYEGKKGEFAKDREGKRIMVNTNRSTEIFRDGQYLGGVVGDVGGITLDESYRLSLVHELQHNIQRREKWPRGGSPATVVNEAVKKLGGKVNTLREAFTLIENSVAEGNTDQVVLKAFNVLNQGAEEAFKSYLLLYGEVEARTVELAMLDVIKGKEIADIPFTEFRNKLLELEGLSTEELIAVPRGEGDALQSSPEIVQPLMTEEMLENVSRILDSKPKVLNLYDEAELAEIDSKLDECR